MNLKHKKLEQEYRKFYANPRNLKEAKQWEKAEIESWLNYEKKQEQKRLISHGLFTSHFL